MGVPKSSVAPTCMMSSPLSRWNLTNMSAGRYVEVMCPRWISPLAYIRAVVTMIFSSLCAPPNGRYTMSCYTYLSETDCEYRGCLCVRSLVDRPLI